MAGMSPGELEILFNELRELAAAIYSCYAYMKAAPWFKVTFITDWFVLQTPPSHVSFPYITIARRGITALIMMLRDSYGRA